MKKNTIERPEAILRGLRQIKREQDTVTVKPDKSTAVYMLTVAFLRTGRR